MSNAPGLRLHDGARVPPGQRISSFDVLAWATTAVLLPAFAGGLLQFALVWRAERVLAAAAAAGACEAMAARTSLAAVHAAVQRDLTRRSPGASLSGLTVSLAGKPQTDWRVLNVAPETELKITGSMPASLAAPDLFAWAGFSLRGLQIRASYSVRTP